MPNGGSDCCGTCWFNTANDAPQEEEEQQRTGREPGYCSIRQLDVSCSPTGPYYTYCANHPHRNPGKIKTPLGPVFVGDDEGQRHLWFLSPDTDEVRRALVAYVEAMPEQPPEEYPLGIAIEPLVIWQLGEFRERRAVPGLLRVLAFDPDATAEGPVPVDRQGTIEAAREALAKIAAISD